MICSDVLDWHNRGVEQLLEDRVAPRIRDKHKYSFRGMAVIKSSISGSLEYISIVCLLQPFSSRPHLVKWPIMAEIWHSAVPSYGMMSPARQMVLNFLLFLRTPKVTLIIYVPLWLVTPECNCLTCLKFPMDLHSKHLLSRYKTLRIFLIYFMHGIIFATSELGLVAISIEIMLTQIQICDVQFERHSRISLSELICYFM